MAMLEGCTELSLALLNEATQAWVEQEYNRRRHSELGCSPLERHLAGEDVGRESPGSDTLRRVFRAEVMRRQRRSDGTFSLEGRRFEVPGRYRHLERLTVRYARWDLSAVALIDPRTGTHLCPLYPLDKTANADGRRAPARVVARYADSTTAAERLHGAAATSAHDEYAATGLPPAYLPMRGDDNDQQNESTERTPTEDTSS